MALKKIRSVQLSFNNSSASEIDMNDYKTAGSGGSAQRFVLKSDADCYINFDEDATTDNYLMEASDDPIMVPAQATKISALGSAGSGKLYIMAIA